MAIKSNNNNKLLLCAGINTYQDRDGLERCIRSLVGGVDKVIVVDGRYPSWGKETDPEYSTDGTEELCKDKQQLNKLVPIEYVQLFEEQPAKRSKYLELAADCDFLLVIDCDEFIVTSGLERADWSEFRKNLQTLPRFEERLKDNIQHVHNIAFMTEPRRLMTFGRLIYRPSELYYSSHWRLNRRSNGVETRYQRMNSRDIVRGITMTYDELMRPSERLEVDVDYQWYLEYKEGDLTWKDYNDPELKKKFLEHNIHEVEVWQNEAHHKPEYEKDLSLNQPSARRRQALGIS